MSDHNNVLAVLAQALAPFILQHIQNGGTAPQQPNTGGFAPQGGGFAPAATGGFGAQPQQQPVQQQANTNPFGGGAPVQQQQAQVTPSMIQELIMPLVQNEQIKNELVKHMAAMGINELPQATAAQLPELYQRFKQVEEQARAAGLLNAPAGGAPSII